MKKEVLNLEREKEMLCTSSKRVWENALKEIEAVAKEMNLTKEQKNGLLQRAMASIRISDLQATNQYLSRTNEEYSQRAVKKNKLEIQRLKHVNEDHYDDVKEIEKEANKRLQEMQQQRLNKKTNKLAKAA